MAVAGRVMKLICLQNIQKSRSRQHAQLIHKLPVVKTVLDGL